MLGRLEGMKDLIEHVNKQFKDPVRSHSWEIYSNFINLLVAIRPLFFQFGIYNSIDS